MRLKAGLLVLALAGCSDMITPTRVAPYEYRLLPARTGRTDIISFKWPRSFLPVRIWVAADDVLRPHVAEAINRWEAAFLYGEFRAELVSDSSRADVIVRNTLSPGGGGLVKERLLAQRPECIGETVFDDTGWPSSQLLPLRIFIAPRFAPTDPGMAACYAITATHELGHAIGLLEHSSDAGDVMFANPVLDGLSERDIVTAETVYHVQPSLTPTGRR